MKAKPRFLKQKVSIEVALNPQAGMTTSEKSKSESLCFDTADFQHPEAYKLLSPRWQNIFIAEISTTRGEKIFITCQIWKNAFKKLLFFCFV